MSFKHNWNAYKENTDIATGFFRKNDVIEKKLILVKFDLSPTQHYTQEWGEFVLEGSISYPGDISHIYLSSIEDYGLFSTSEHIEINTIEDYIQKSASETIYEANFNESKLVNPNIEYNNSTKEISVEVKLEGELNDIFLIDEWGYYMVLEVYVVNKNASYSSQLLLEGWDLYEKKNWDLSLLVFYSAIDNMITLEAEKLQNSYYKEINIITLEFKPKVSLILKEAVKPNFSNQDFGALSFVIKELTSLYKLRNNVAHGTKRSIAKKDCENCFELYLFLITIIEKGSLSTTDLIRDVKTLVT